MVDLDDTELAARLKRLDAGAAAAAPGFDYDSLLERHAEGQRRSRRRLAVARGSAAALVLTLVGASLWRLGQGERDSTVTAEAGAREIAISTEPRIVRADSYLAVAALEDHIASLDDALNYARLRGGADEVARLERTRAELFASYSQLRYAERVSANF
jgi:hypothetical protein